MEKERKGKRQQYEFSATFQRWYNAVSMMGYIRLQQCTQISNIYVQ